MVLAPCPAKGEGAGLALPAWGCGIPVSPHPELWGCRVPLRFSLGAGSRALLDLLGCLEEEWWCPWISLLVGQWGWGLAELPVSPGRLCWCCSPAARVARLSWRGQLSNCTRSTLAGCRQLGICIPACLEGAPGTVGASFTLCILRKTGVFSLIWDDFFPLALPSPARVQHVWALGWQERGEAGSKAGACGTRCRQVLGADVVLPLGTSNP